MFFTKEIFVPKDKAGSNHVAIEDTFDTFDISGGRRKPSRERTIQFLSSVFSAGPTCGYIHAYLVAEGVLFLLRRQGSSSLKCHFNSDVC